MNWVLLVMLSATPALTVEEVVSSTLELYPQMIAARTDIDAADGENLAARGAFDPGWKTTGTWIPVSGYPQVRVDSVVDVPTPLWGATFFGGYRYGAGKIQSYYGGRETWTGGELRAGAVVPVLLNGPYDRRRANIARTAIARDLASLSVEQQRLELTRMATTRYWEWIAAGEKRGTAKALLEIALERDRQLGSRANEGDVAHFDRQDNVRALKQRQAQLTQAQRGVEQAAFELSLFIRDADGNPTIPTDDRLARLVPPGTLREEQWSIDAALERRPDVRRLTGQQNQAAIEVRYAENQVLPKLDVGVVVSKDLGAPPRPELESLGPAEIELNAVLDIPILYRAALGKLQAARAGMRRIQAQLQMTRDRVTAEVNDASSAFRAAQERTVLAAEEIAAASEVETGERTRFEMGESSLVFVNLREQTTAEARLREIDALLDGHRALATLRLSLGLGTE